MYYREKYLADKYNADIDQLLKHIALYGAEVWGPDLLNLESTAKVIDSINKFAEQS